MSISVQAGVTYGLSLLLNNTCIGGRFLGATKQLFCMQYAVSRSYNASHMHVNTHSCYALYRADISYIWIVRLTFCMMLTSLSTKISAHIRHRLNHKWYRHDHEELAYILLYHMEESSPLSGCRMDSSLFQKRCMFASMPQYCHDHCNSTRELMACHNRTCRPVPALLWRQNGCTIAWLADIAFQPDVSQANELKQWSC